MIKYICDICGKDADDKFNLCVDIRPLHGAGYKLTEGNPTAYAHYLICSKCAEKIINRITEINSSMEEKNND